jgi:hypothetical protein
LNGPSGEGPLDKRPSGEGPLETRTLAHGPGNRRNGVARTERRGGGWYVGHRVHVKRSPLPTQPNPIQPSPPIPNPAHPSTQPQTHPSQSQPIPNPTHPQTQRVWQVVVFISRRTAFCVAFAGPGRPGDAQSKPTSAATAALWQSTTSAEWPSSIAGHAAPTIEGSLGQDSASLKPPRLVKARPVGGPPGENEISLSVS